MTSHPAHQDLHGSVKMKEQSQRRA